MRRAVLVFALLAAPLCAQDSHRIVRIGNATIPPAVAAAALPACNASSNGNVYAVTNALTPVLGVAVTGGGAVNVLVRCNGTNWLVGQ